MRTHLTYRKLPFADRSWTLGKNKGHFIILELNSGIIKWPHFLPNFFVHEKIGRSKECALGYKDAVYSNCLHR